MQLYVNGCIELQKLSVKVLIKLTNQDHFASLRTRLTAATGLDFCIVLCIKPGEKSLFTSSS